MTEKRSILRRSAIAIAAAGLSLATVVASVHPPDSVLAQSDDAEVAQANVDAQWPVSYANNQAYSVQFAKRGEGNADHAVDSTYRWQLQNYGSSEGTSEHLHTDRRIRQSAPVEDTSPYADGIYRDDTNQANYRIETGYTVSNNAIQTPGSIGTQRCLYTSYAPVSSTDNGRCGAQTDDTAAARNRVPGFGYSYRDRALDIDSGAIWLNGWDLETSVRCSPNGAVANRPSGNLDAVTGGLVLSGTAQGPRYGRNADVNPMWRTADGTTANKAFSSTPQRVYYGTILLETTETAVKFKPMVRTYTEGNYALSEIGVYVETYVRVWVLFAPLGWNLKSKAYHVISKSECGASSNGANALPPRSTAIPQLPILDNESEATNNDLSSYFSTVDRETAVGRQASTRVRALNHSGARATDEPALSTTSPLAGATGTEVTTSAPPENDNDFDAPQASQGAPTTSGTTPDTMSESTTESPRTISPGDSTVQTIPSRPGVLPADIDVCGEVDIDGQRTEAFVAAGVDCETATRISAMGALEDYIADGTQDSRWKGFTSDDPAVDGWRWAAIDQRTGHIVYVP